MNKRVTVIVLGDVGRSPRMQQHCLSLAAAGWSVTFVGYRGTSCREALETNPRITQLLLDPPQFPRLSQTRVGWAVSAALRLLWLTVALLWALLWASPRPKVWLVQTPPAVPTLVLLRVVRGVRGGRVVVDWHNSGTALLALRPAARPLLPLYRWGERWGGRGGDCHVTVSQAFREQLLSWGIRPPPTVLYDRPPAHWRPLEPSERTQLWERLGKEHPALVPLCAPETRPAVGVSSTSWTDDEDFEPLVQALHLYDGRVREGHAPPLCMLITGKGPNRSYWESRLRALALEHVTWACLWVSAEDYPRVLGAADVGVSLHQSAGGVDLPMKVVDMFACTLPVAAVAFPALPELVTPRHTGLLFHSAQELAEQLVELLQGFPKPSPLATHLRKNIQEWRKETWEDNWNAIALPIFESFVDSPNKKET